MAHGRVVGRLIRFRGLLLTAKARQPTAVAKSHLLHLHGIAIRA